MNTKFLTAITAAWMTCGTAMAEIDYTQIPTPGPMPEANQGGTISIDGIEMYYAVFGPSDAESVPILMIHGGLGHAEIWAPQIADLAQDHQIIVADTRGHGRSANDGSTYTYDLLASDYVGLLDSLDVDQVHLVGWSDGANIGFVLSQTAPERLASHFAHAGNVTLDGIDPTVGENAVFGAYISQMGEDYARLNPTSVTYEDFLGAVAQMWSTEKPGGIEALTEVDVPTTIVHSQFDEAILEDHSEAMANAIPGSRYILLEGVSHFASLQSPDAYTRAIREHLDWVDGLQ